MEEKNPTQRAGDPGMSAESTPETRDVAAQVRTEFEKYMEKRDAARRSLGKLRRTALLEKLLS